ncbi:MAG: hypothetical protein ACRERV_16645, partial [Methylococcales bacterium]
MKSIDKLGFGLIALSITAAAVGDEPDSGSDLLDRLAEGFSNRFYMQGFGTAQQPADSALNAANRLGIPRYQMAVDIRPDLFLDYDYFSAIFKPRMQLRANQWEDGIYDNQSHTDTDFFIYEGSLTLKFDNRVFISYGRENLQWGPAAMLSASNPFNQNNNQNSPATELQAMDYAKLIWVPSAKFSASFLTNTDIGRFKEPFNRGFHNTYALKLDYTGKDYYLSLIPSYQHEGEKFRLGYIGQWNITDAVLVYSEGSIIEQKGDFSLLFGGAYTFQKGGTVSFEYLHHENGCTLEPVSLCLTPAYNDNPLGAFFRKDYLQFQYYDGEIFDRFNLLLRWTYGLNDRSNFAIGYLQYEIG